MKQIISIGGGGFTDPNKKFKMERYLLEQTGKKNPKICFLPQASAEAQDYIVKFYNTFISLGAVPSWISLFGRVENRWKQQLLEQDLIYVGGGNTKSMLALWRDWHMDKVLMEAYQKGIILSGISAGAICWFEQCVTDSVWPLGVIEGLKLLEGSCCPHYDSELERRPTFLDKVKKNEIMPGIALQDYTAAHYVDGKLKCVVSEMVGHQGYFVTAEHEKVIEAIELE